MPIRKENLHKYPKNWPAISALARFKAGNKCQDCGLPNGALGGRYPGTGVWHDALPIGDNGLRLLWPSPGDNDYCVGKYRTICLRIIRIILTLSHKNHQPEDYRPRNLRVLCQQCHLRYDAKEKARGIKTRNRAARASHDLFPA